ncbi:MAG: molybdopterin adenylyltransferase [Nitrospirae bacterium]|nr:molybdopterin adenylyltransferase [Nitrospirota bacterium]
MIQVGIITISDKAWQGKRKDRSGELIKELLEKIESRVVVCEVVPDERKCIEEKLKKMADELEVDLILTTGGTGLSPRDVTPEATLAVIQREVPGLTELIRSQGRKSTPYAVLSRARAGIRDRTLIINLPGSPRGVKESLEAILDVIPHGIEILRGEKGECAQNSCQKESRPIF